MQKFISREKEISFLNERYESKESELIVIYGRRRVGKTELIKQFIADKKSLYLLGEIEGEEQIVRTYSSIAGDVLADDFLRNNPQDSWRALFDYLTRYVTKTGDKFVLIFDELPFIYRANRNFISTLQYFWDEKWKNENMMLILCGSSISMMEKLCLSYSSPIYGRRTGQIDLLPFTFFEASKFFKRWDMEEKVKAYAILGGIPRYLEEFDDRIPLRENIKRRMLNRDAFLYKETSILLHEELKSYANYFAILKSIAFGSTTFNEISQNASIATNKLPVYLSNLSNLHIILKEHPVTEKREKRRNTRYRIKDNFFRFWFRYIYTNQSLLEIGNVPPIMRKIQKEIDFFVSPLVEDIVRDLIIRLSGDGRLPEFTRFGRWWHKDKEIDLIALNDETNSILFGEVKWSNKKVGISQLEKLKRTAQSVEWKNKNRKEYYAVFSKSGFEKDLKKQRDVFLFDLKSLKLS